MITIRVGLSILLLVSVAAAQERRPDSAWDLIAREHDHDKDGAVSAEEYSRGEARFRRLDRDGDGKLTPADFEGGSRRGPRARGPEAMRPRILGRLLGVGEDRPFELEGFAAWFGEQDGNDDRILDLDEIGFDRRAEMMLRILDVDGSGALEFDELEGVAKGADADRDGKISAAEIRGGRGSRSAAPSVGKRAPDFDLPYKTGDETAKLSSFAGKRPVALIFGSYT